MHSSSSPQAWVEIDLRRFRNNLDLIWRDKNPALGVLAVIKDDAYGHGAPELARIWEQRGVSFFAVATLQEGLQLRREGITKPILIFGERQPDDWEICLREKLTPCICAVQSVRELGAFLRSRKQQLPVHLKMDSGMSRYGVRWSDTPKLIEALRAESNIIVDGIFSHFAMSDELDKSFANLQLSRFQEALGYFEQAGISARHVHMSNSGGFLDLPPAHFDLVRVGILSYGVYPSKVCRRIEGIRAVMSVKTRVALIKELSEGDKVGYGMRYTAPGTMRLAVIPIGYGAGFPRVRNQGYALIRGKRAPLIGGVSMDAITVDVTGIPDLQPWDVATILGDDGSEEISVHELAALKNTVSYDVLVSWHRMPRRYIE